MATTNVPIEIVLQDPNDPIVPTPDSDGGSDNTNNNSNIAVPNTALGEGHTTTDGSSNTGGFFGSSSAAATIIPAVVLTLALGAVVALLIRRHYKNKKSDNVNQKQTTKKEKLAMAATSTMAVLAATVLVGNLLMTTTNAATSEGTELSTPDKIQIIANRYDDVTIVASTKAVSYATTDTTFGYKIFMSMAGDNANLYLDGDTSSENYFTATENAGLDDNSWGYSLNGKANYTAMPLASDPLMAQQNVNAVSDDEFTVYYTMKADKDMPFGVYSGEIAYDIQGYNNFPTSLTTMQGMTSAICDAVYTPSGTETIVPTATLTDTRDNKTYEIAKLADGNCWMTQNLDLDLSTETALTTANTNISSNWTPERSTITTGNLSSTTWPSDPDANNDPYSYDPGDVFYYSSGNMNNDTPYTSLADCQAEHPDCSMKNHAGNYYSWSAAIASNDTSTITTQYTNVSTDICPAGWKLPDGPNAQQIDYSDMGNLAASYDNITKKPINQECGGTCNNYSYVDDGFNVIRTAPLWLARSGNVLDGFVRDNNAGYYWSSTASYGRNAYYFYFGSYSLAPARDNNRYYGYPIRCIAQ